MEPSLDAYKAFVCAARTKSLSAAARELYLSQPTVTHHLQNLEACHGCRLFVRTRRGVTLTPEGKILYDYLSEALARIDEARDVLEAHRTLARGVVRVGATETTLHHFLLPRLRRFKETYPDIRLKIANGSTPGMLTDLDEGAIDFAVLVLAKEGLEGAYRTTPLAELRDVVIAGEKYRSALNGATTLEQLADFPLICMTPGTLSRDHIEAVFRSEGLSLSPDMELATADLITPLVENGLGIGFVPHAFARDAIARRTVFEVQLEHPLPPRSICLVCSPAHPLSAAARAFTEMLTSQDKKQPAGT